MDGRLEHSLRIERNIENILNGLPKYVSEYYYSIAPSTEPRTCEDYLRKIRKFLSFCGNINNITDTDIGKYLKNIQVKNINGEYQSTSFSYQKATWTALNGFFKYMYEKKYIKNNPMKLVSRPNKEDDVHKVTLDISDINNIISNIENGAGSNYAKSRQQEWVERDLAIFKLFICTGMRKTALSEINISDLDFENNMIKIIDKRHKTHEYYMQDKLKECLLTWCRKRREILNGEKEDALFISMRKKRMNEKSIYNVVTKYSEETLGYKISPHKLRAVFCVTYYEATGGDIKSTMEAMGQKSVITTQRYINQKNNAREDSSKILNSLII